MKQHPLDRLWQDMTDYETTEPDAAACAAATGGKGRTMASEAKHTMPEKLAFEDWSGDGRTFDDGAIISPDLPSAFNVIAYSSHDEEILTALVSRYNTHKSYARAAEALREVIEADTYGKSHYLLALQGGDVEAAEAMNKRMDDAWASARDALAALKEVE